MVIYGIMWNCEEPFQVTNIDRAKSNAIAQGVL